MKTLIKSVLGAFPFLFVVTAVAAETQRHRLAGTEGRGQVAAAER